jgi:hypothetical protein
LTSGVRLILSVVFLAFAAVAPVLACSIITSPHELDPQEQLIDRTPPERIEATVARIGRGRGPVVQEDGTVTGTSCDDVGSVGLKLKFIPKDDRTAPEKLGYRFIHVGGVLPEGLQISDHATHDLRMNEELFLHWGDGAIDNQESIEFAIAIIAVDLGGNESAPSEKIWVRHSGSTPQPN